MAIVTATGNLAKDNSGTANATNTISNPLGGTAPKAVVLWTVGATATGFAAGERFSLGFGDGTTDKCISYAVDDNVSTTNVGHAYKSKGVAIYTDGTPTLGCECDISFSGNDVVLTWTTNDTNAFIIHYWVIGGSDITNAVVVENACRTAAGNFDYTNVGFQGDVAFHIVGGVTAAGTGTGLNGFGWGAMISTSARWGYTPSGQDALTMNITANRRQLTTSALMGDIASAGSDFRADFVAWLSNGFTLNWTDQAVSAWLFASLVLKGGQYGVGAYNKATGAAPVAQDVSLTFTPVGLFQSTMHAAASITDQNDHNTNISASDGTNDRSVWAGQKDLTLPTQADRNTSNTKGFILATPANPPAATDAECTVAFAASKFTPTWNPNTGTADEITYIAVGSAAATTPTVAAWQSWTDAAGMVGRIWR